MKITRKQGSIFYLILLIILIVILIVAYPLAMSQIQNYIMTISLFLGVVVIPFIYFAFASCLTVLSGLKFTALSKKVNCIVRYISLAILVLYLISSIAVLVFNQGGLFSYYLGLLISFNGIFILLGIIVNATIDYQIKSIVKENFVSELNENEKKESSTDDSLVQ
ncbi:hypothetical protein [Anaerorhabdus sp.]|uniref:hypothetical protein n=1 Tax=Anaerorhabdus sp. TaxID=1872524 RepID=UPI002FC62B41